MVPASVIQMVLIKYLEIGIWLLPIRLNKSIKLAMVNFLGKSFGGNKNISLSGLKALNIANING